MRLCNEKNLKNVRYCPKNVMAGEKNYKLLGRLWNIRYGINRKKALAVNTAIKLQRFFKNRKITINDEIKSFQSHITYIFLRHFEPWKITKKIIET